ncbi:sensor histidine kinase [Neorhodopirellula pilleata]|nr:ATP-binding protein [Neorhodopirellula pilleata]
MPDLSTVTTGTGPNSPGSRSLSRWNLIAAGVFLLALPLMGAPAWLVAIVAVAAIVLMARRYNDQREDLIDQIHQTQGESKREVALWRADLKSLESQSRLGASALLQLIDGVVVLSTDLSILLINPSAINLLGMKAKESLPGRRFDEMVRNPPMVKLIRAAINERHAQESVIEFQFGKIVRPLRVRADVINDEDSFKVQLSLRDETEARQIEGMRREFVANVSHELKTPLAAIKGYAETVELAAADDPDMAIHFMNQIVTQCHRLERLISDMMQLARAQSGKALMKLSSVPMRDIVAESVRTYEPVAIASGLTLTWHEIDGPAKVLADPEAALTICNNLIGNAIRYTPRGGRIDVSLQPGHGHWTLIVQDTGVGIPEQDQTKIFERFYRASRNAEMTNSSTGLGLAIVKNLTASLDGHVSVQSAPGKGSTFRVELPAVEFKARPLPIVETATSPVQVNV